MTQVFYNHTFKHDYILTLVPIHWNWEFEHKLGQNKSLNWFSSINMAQHTDRNFFFSPLPAGNISGCATDLRYRSKCFKWFSILSASSMQSAVQGTWNKSFHSQKCTL